MLCPALLDPFEGQNYRLFACAHQAILCPILCKMYCYFFKLNAFKFDEIVNNRDRNKVEDINTLTSIIQPSLPQSISDDNIICDKIKENKAIMNLVENNFNKKVK